MQSAARRPRPGPGRLIRYPCMSVQPSARMMAACSGVSTPSAVVVMPRLAPRAAMARMAAINSALPVRSVKNERSILSLSNGKLRNWLKDE